MTDFFKDLNLFFIVGSAGWFGSYLTKIRKGKNKKEGRVVSIENYGKPCYAYKLMEM